MDSPLRVDARAYRTEALRQAEKRLADARTTEEKHYARLALARAKRAVG
jgi:hypothetical protein